MKIRTIAGIAFAAFAIFGCAGAARADQVFCAATIHWVTPATPSAKSDTTYDVVVRTFGPGEITHARLAVLDGQREYEFEVPVEGKSTVPEELTGGTATQFRPLALHFAKPLELQAAWIEHVGDDKGNGADCLPNAGVVDDGSDVRLADLRAKYNADARTNPLDVRVSDQDSIKFITPENCAKRYVEPVPFGPVTLGFSEQAKTSLAGSVTVYVRVNLKPDGEVAYAFIQKSSGNMYIDKAAIDAAQQTTYVPKKVDCLPFAGTYLFRATFDPDA